MVKRLGLFLFAFALWAQAFGASSTLFLRASVSPTFTVDLSSGTPKLITNLPDGEIKPRLKVERRGQGYLVSVIHP